MYALRWRSSICANIDLARGGEGWGGGAYQGRVCMHLNVMTCENLIFAMLSDYIITSQDECKTIKGIDTHTQYTVFTYLSDALCLVHMSNILHWWIDEIVVTQEWQHVIVFCNSLSQRPSLWSVWRTWCRPSFCCWTVSAFRRSLA